MAIIKTKVQQDLTSMVHVTPLKGLFFGGDVEGNMLGVYVTDKGQPVELTGNCRGYVILSDNSSFMIDGEIEESTAWITLPAACYSKTGVISIVIKVGTVTLAAFCGCVHKTLTETIIDPERIIPSIEELVEKIAQMEAVMEGAENVDVDVTKSGNVVTISTTNRQGVTKTQNFTALTPEEISEIEQDISDLQNSFAEHEEHAEDTYAKQDGYYQDMAVGTAEQLVSSKFVEDQEPYTLRAAGGSADIGNRENLKAVVGGTLAWNQQVRDEASDNVTEFADIVTVDDAVADNAGVKVKLEPVQDLHGYDHPWPGGGSDNLIPPINPWPTGDTLIKEFPAEISIQGCALTFKFSGSYTYGGAAFLALKDSNGNNSAVFTMGNMRKVSDNTLLTAETTYTNERVYAVGSVSNTYNIKAIYSYSNAAFSNASFDELMLEQGSTVNPYKPYANVCPITGCDAVKVTGTGKNLYSGTDIEIPANAYYVTSFSSMLKEALKKLKPGHTYTCSAVYYARESAAGSIDIVFSDGQPTITLLFATKRLSIDRQSWTFTIPTNVNFDSLRWVIVYAGAPDNQTIAYVKDIQIEPGSTATDYEPYSGQTYNITLPSEAGTVYGGSLTVNKDGTGQLAVDRAIITKLWSEFTNKAIGDVYAEGRAVLPSIDSARRTEAICDCLKYSTAGEDYGYCFYAPSGSNYVRAIVVADVKDTDSFTFVYPLVTPQTYTLTATQVQTLLGTNNVWADAGQVSLTYKGTDEHLTLTDGRKYLTRINGVDSMVLGAGQALTAVKGRDNVFDLTQMFGTAAVADYVYGQGTGYFRKWFPLARYGYNQGELKSVEGLQSHDTVGFNLLDESQDGVIVGSYRIIDFPAGLLGKCNVYLIDKDPSINIPTNLSFGFVIQNITAVSSLTADDFRWVVYNGEIRPNTSNTSGGVVYGDGEKLLGAVFMYPNDITYWNLLRRRYKICISFVNNGSRNGEYEPYEKHSYPLDSTLTLRGIPKAGVNGIYWDGDQYKPDGTVERRYGVVDLGSLTWTYDSTYNRFNTVVAPAKTAGTARTEPIACAKYVPIYDRRSIANVPDKAIYRGTDHDLSVHDSAYTDAAAFKAAMSGVYLIYELATPTSETADPYRELQIVDDWGTEEFVTTGLVPVGHVTQYPANLRDKLQHLPDLASSNGIYIVKQTDSEMELMRLPDMPTANGNYRLKLNVASGSPTFSWEVVT